ncbi:OmpA family protein [Vibrio cincinnatiensis]|uniref:OmpA family protein n=1 Tax=Vibrio cincinnatiensis TaxID=675 RepID=UPI001EDCC05D|nr:OmpA family protein [Vibrio cincinnatiensis]MCG3728914.1 OmpA family protein [Vibrio cincinnatiensis]
MKKITLLASLLSIPVLAETEPPQFFIGAKGGYQWASDDTYNHSEPSGSIWGVYGGVHLSSVWSWDMGYQYHDELKADATSVNVKTWLIESALRYDWYLQDNLSLYGRLGVAYWDMEKKQLSSDKLDATGFSPLGEVGINYNLTPSIRLSAGYQYIDSIGKSNTGKYDSHAALISLAYTFGHTTQSTLVETAPVIENSSESGEEIIDSESLLQTWTFSAKTIEGGFDFDAIKLSNNLIQSLTEVASVLNIHPQARAVIVGHTDSTGAEAYNQTLSERRAQAVVNQLIDLGVNPEKIESWGEGESNPIADNVTIEGRAQNRRVEVTIPSFKFQE